MDCQDALLMLETSARSGSVAYRAAEAHVAACAGCRSYRQRQSHLQRRLAPLAMVAAPASVRRRISRALRTEDRATPRLLHRWAWVPMAAAAALFFLVRPAVPTTVASGLATTARAGLDSMLLRPEWTATQYETWLEAQLGFDVDIPDIDGAMLVGARVATMDGQTGAAVAYLQDGMPVTYFRLPSDRVFGGPVRAGRVRTASTDGYQVAVWREGPTARAVVSPLPRRALASIAKECQALASTD
jgi:anti-sigma factor RsiW